MKNKLLGIVLGELLKEGKIETDEFGYFKCVKKAKTDCGLESVLAKKDLGRPGDVTCP